MAGLIYATTLGSSAAAANAPFLVRVFTTQAGWTMMIVGCSAGAIFAVLALAIFCISFPLVLKTNAPDLRFKTEDAKSVLAIIARFAGANIHPEMKDSL